MSSFVRTSAAAENLQELDTMIAGTCDGFLNVVDWAAVQPWNCGKVGLLGISYYAGSQWQVAVRRP